MMSRGLQLLPSLYAAGHSSACAQCDASQSTQLWHMILLLILIEKREFWKYKLRKFSPHAWLASGWLLLQVDVHSRVGQGFRSPRSL